MELKKIAVIGAGNGGQAMAGHLAMMGQAVALHDKSADIINDISRTGGITLTDAISGFGKLSVITHDLEEALTGAGLIMVVTTADAHRTLAIQMAPLLERGQIVVLNPGRTLGALEFYNQIKAHSNKEVIVGETQSLVYACRSEKNGEVRIIGVKDRVFLGAYPSKNIKLVSECLGNLYQCFVPVESILRTGLENIGAIFHPPVVLFNAAAIERGSSFYFYNDMTPGIAAFLEKLDAERIKVGKAYGFDLLPIEKWVSYAYPGVEGKNLCEKMQNNPAYYKILAPTTIRTRLITEDIPTGLVPLSQLGDLAGVDTTLTRSLVNICSHLVGINFWETGRNLKNLGLSGKTYEQIKKDL